MRNKILIIVFILGLSNISFAQKQSDLDQYNVERLKIQRKGMATLGGWAIGNMAWGAIGMSNTTGAQKEFHGMNLYWNVVNLALAVPGFIGAKKDASGFSLRKTYKEQQKVEKTFLINAGLDIGYMLGGLYLTERSKQMTTIASRDRSLGYGNSFILQGGFLFLLDYTLFAVNSRHGNKKLAPLLDNIVIESRGIGYIHRF